MAWTEGARLLSRELAKELGQLPLDASARRPVPDGCDFIVYSRSQLGKAYPMVLTPEGYAVHQLEGCEGEIFNGPLGCWHVKETSMKDTRSVVPYRAGTLAPPMTFNEEHIEVLKNTIARGVSDVELQLFIATCQRTRLDPFARQIHAVVRNVREGDTWVKRMTIQIGIDGMRLIAERTGKYAGGDGPQWSSNGEQWRDAWTGINPPAFARYAAWRKDCERPFVAVCRYESYVQTSATGEALALWRKMPDVMLAKCAESLALRRAFPSEMSGFEAAVDEGYADVYDAEVDEPPAAQPGLLPETESSPMPETGTETEIDIPAAPPANGADAETERAGAGGTPAAPTPDEPPAETPATNEYAALNAWWKDTRAVDLDRRAVLEASDARFGREPMDLTPDERDELLTALLAAREPILSES